MGTAGIIPYNNLPLLVSGEDAGKPQVTTCYGTLRGKTVTVKETDRTVHTFYGIPFAKRPVGPLRFAAPQPPEPWTAVREAAEYPPISWCSSIVKGALCDIVLLYRQVMMFIHGGGLRMWGASLYEGSMMSAMEDVVVVSIQYRLGMLGFLRSEDGRVSGNFGFLDQVAGVELFL
ncbi:fatty acyl-CoA hydrolase precursor, medium chain-like [Mantella aurantiaca]